jgi:hypothetical protein
LNLPMNLSIVLIFGSLITMYFGEHSLGWILLDYFEILVPVCSYFPLGLRSFQVLFL